MNTTGWVNVFEHSLRIQLMSPWTSNKGTESFNQSNFEFQAPIESGADTHTWWHTHTHTEWQLLAFFSRLGVLGDILHSGAIGHILSVSCCSYTIHVWISRSLAKRAVLAVRSRRILPHCASPEGTLALRKFVKISSSIFVPIFIGISRNLVESIKIIRYLRKIVKIYEIWVRFELDTS